MQLEDALLLSGSQELSCLQVEATELFTHVFDRLSIHIVPDVCRAPDWRKYFALHRLGESILFVRGFPAARPGVATVGRAPEHCV